MSTKIQMSKNVNDPNIAELNRIGLYGMSGGVSFLQQTASNKRIIKRLSYISFKAVVYHYNFAIIWLYAFAFTVIFVF